MRLNVFGQEASITIMWTLSIVGLQFLPLVTELLYQQQSLVTAVSTTLHYKCNKSGHSHRNDKCIGRLSYRWVSLLRLPELIIK